MLSIPHRPFNGHIKKEKPMLSIAALLAHKEWQCKEEGQDRDDLGVDWLRKQEDMLQSDAPACDSCGAITVRNGNCYLCHNCGQSMGCS